jgi:hypothetical protein
MTTGPAALRWRRSEAGWASYVADWPGPLGEDGAVVVVGRHDPLHGRCPACGRRGPLWQAVLGLPKPFPGALDAVRGGCSRAHAAHLLPGDWIDVSAVFALLAEALREDDEPTLWHEKLAVLRSRQAERALLLSRLERPARRIALELWRNDELLPVDDTEAIVAAVLTRAAR